MEAREDVLEVPQQGIVKEKSQTLFWIEQELKKLEPQKMELQDYIKKLPSQVVGTSKNLGLKAQGSMHISNIKLRNLQQQNVDLQNRIKNIEDEFSNTEMLRRDYEECDSVRQYNEKMCQLFENITTSIDSNLNQIDEMRAQIKSKHELMKQKKNLGMEILQEMERLRQLHHKISRPNIILPNSARKQRSQTNYYKNLSDSKQNFSTAHKSTEDNQSQIRPFTGVLTSNNHNLNANSYYLTEIMEGDSKAPKQHENEIKLIHAKIAQLKSQNEQIQNKLMQKATKCIVLNQIFQDCFQISLQKIEQVHKISSRRGMAGTIYFDIKKHQLNDPETKFKTQKNFFKPDTTSKTSSNIIYDAIKNATAKQILKEQESKHSYHQNLVTQSNLSEQQFLEFTSGQILSLISLQPEVTQKFFDQYSNKIQLQNKIVQFTRQILHYSLKTEDLNPKHYTTQHNFNTSAF